MLTDFEGIRKKIKGTLSQVRDHISELCDKPGLSNTEEYRLGVLKYEVADILGKMNREEDKAKMRYELEVRRLEKTKEDNADTGTTEGKTP